jgi:hypothetical protein
MPFANYSTAPFCKTGRAALDQKDIPTSYHCAALPELTEYTDRERMIQGEERGNYHIIPPQGKADTSFNAYIAKYTWSSHIMTRSYIH